MTDKVGLLAAFLVEIPGIAAILRRQISTRPSRCLNGRRENPDTEAQGGGLGLLDVWKVTSLLSLQWDRDGSGGVA
jgi:hypothetical protein